MKTRPRLTDLPFLAATLAMALTLVMPWAFTATAENGQQVAEAGMIPPWAAAEPASNNLLQLASQASAAPGNPAQP